MAQSLSLERFQRRNSTYYADLRRLHQQLIAPGQRVLEIGCRLGDLLAATAPAHGVGIEADAQMAAAAQARHPGLRIVCAAPEALTPELLGDSQPFDVIVLSNSLNTLADVQAVLERLEPLCHGRTRLVISFHNWLWQPLLKAAEALGQRRPQPPESWLTPGDVTNLLDLAGWEVLKAGQRCLLPRRLPLLTTLANRWLSQLPVLSQLGLTHWLVARPTRLAKPPLPSVSVVIPARNEAGNIGAAIERLPLLGRSTEVIFVEGHSSDDTWARIQQLCATYQGPLQLKALRQTGKGKADAVWLGFEAATGEVLVILDADLTVQPEDLPRFISALAEGRGEFVNGCRLVYPRSKAAMPPLNTAANRFFAAVFAWLLRQRIKDTLCGTKVIWKADYERLKAGRAFFGDFDPFGDFDLLFGASKLNLKIVEVPVRYQERSYGSSNIAHVKEGLILARMCLVAATKLRFTP
ncbi:MAG: glycosyltransferase [Cyanobacteria bacterium K_DeepCast_150m_m2_101]|nr:glycosyltransferase [Cyanobacteria bacterium K_DeepCast_150m_m2_101]